MLVFTLYLFYDIIKFYYNKNKNGQVPDFIILLF